jgi:hypothetical protein
MAPEKTQKLYFRDWSSGSGGGHWLLGLLRLADDGFRIVRELALRATVLADTHAGRSVGGLKDPVVLATVKPEELLGFQRRFLAAVVGRVRGHSTSPVLARGSALLRAQGGLAKS